MQRRVSAKEPDAEELSKIKALFPVISEVENSRILCTVCFKDIKHVILLKRKCYIHPILRVVICKRCCKFYGSGEFSVDEDGSDKYCRWCGQGGNLYLCSSCPSAFCPKCVKKNLDRHAMLEVQSDHWKCLICKPIALLKQRALAWAIVAHLDNMKKKQELKASNAKAKAVTPKPRSKGRLSVKNQGSEVKTVSFPKISLNSEPNEVYLNQAREYLNDFGSNCIKCLEETRGKLKDLSKDEIRTLEDFQKICKSYLEIMNLNTGAFSGFADTMVDYVTSWAKIVAEDNRPLQTAYSNDVEMLTVTPEILMMTPDISIPDGNGVDCETESEKLTAPSKSRTKPVEEPMEVVTSVEGQTPAADVDAVNSVEEESKIPVIRVKNLSELMRKTETINVSSSESEKEDEQPKRIEKSSEGIEKGSDSMEKKGASKKNGNSQSEDQPRKPSGTAKADHTTTNTVSLKKDVEKVPKLKIKLSPPKNPTSPVLGTIEDSSSSDPLSSNSSEDEAVEKSSKRKRISSGDETNNGKKSSKTPKAKPEAGKKWFSSSSEDDLEKIWNFTSITSAKATPKSPGKKTKGKASKKGEPEPSPLDLIESDCSTEGDRPPSVVENSVEEDLGAAFSSTFNVSSNETLQTADIWKDVLAMCSEASNESSDDDAKENKGKNGSSKKQKGGKHGYTDSVLSAKLDAKKKQGKKGAKSYVIDSADSDCTESSTSKAKSKSKKIFSDSEVSQSRSGSEKDKSDDSDDSIQPIKKKGRRIAKRAASSDSSDEKKSKKNSQGTPNKGRKNIKKIIDEKRLDDTTKEALASEKERKERIAEKQKLYNQIMEIGLENHKEIKEVVLDFDPKTKQKLLCVHPDLVKKLKPHQADGIKFMWNACFESIKLSKKEEGSGCILAHCMGLGKTLQVVAFLHTLLTHSDVDVNTALVIAPFSTILNWVNEFKKWLTDIGSGEDVEIYHLTKVAVANRASQLKEWHRTGGVMIMGYNMFRTLVGEKTKAKKSFKEAFNHTLLDPGPDIVICDEGHVLKNEATALSVCTSKIRTARRIVLTGTPLQNNLSEYHCMVQFIKPSLLGTKKEFKNRFVNPITNGQFEDSTARDVKIMKRRAHVLHTMLDGIVQRKDYTVLTPYLPPKYEYVIHLKLSEIQILLYRTYLEQCTNGGVNRKLFNDFQNLLWICLHPRSLLMKSEKDDKKAQMIDDESDEEGSLKDFIDDSDDSKSSDFRSSSSSSDDDQTSKSGSNSGLAPKRNGRKGRSAGSPDVEFVGQEKQKDWWSDLVTDEQLEDIKQSTKIFMFFKILRLCGEIGDKLLVFSQSLYTLDIIEYFLDKVDCSTQADEPDPGCAGFTGSWCKGLDYFRLDGGTNSENRDKFCKSFNDHENVRSRLFLISTRAGGLGINLTGANRVIIFDASWNPSYDVQSLFRVFRFGQTKPCYIYRFLSKGTMEEKIYERQVAKLSTSLRVVDEQQIERHFSHSSMAELYTFSPEQDVQETPVLPKDRLMAELFQSHKELILAHHQHDSLLENKEEEELTEEERKAAWVDFEQEKTNPVANFPPGGFAGVHQGNGGINQLNQFLLQIQQALKQNKPNLSPEEIRIESLKIVQSNPTFSHLYTSAFGDTIFNNSASRAGQQPDFRAYQQQQQLQQHILLQQQRFNNQGMQQQQQYASSSPYEPNRISLQNLLESSPSVMQQRQQYALTGQPYPPKGFSFFGQHAGPSLQQQQLQAGSSSSKKPDGVIEIE